MTKEELEKEAEEWVKENMDCCKTDNSVNRSIPYFDEEERCCAKSAFQDGAEFGYNKAKVEVEESYRESLCNSELNLASVTEQLEELEKANEWHFVKDGDLPNTETKNYTYIRRRKRYERQFTDYRVIKCYVLCINENGKITAEIGYFDCNKKCFLDKAEGKIYAWKEIVLPKESE